MAVVRVSPYPVAESGVVTAGAWLGIYNGEEVQLADQLTGWDGATPVELRRRVSIDLVGLASQTGLRPGDKIGLCVLWSSSATSLRGASTPEIIDAGHEEWAGEVSCSLDPGELGGVLEISTTIVLVSRPTPAEPGYASTQGNVLWSDKPHRVTLEGGMTRFPIEIVAMAEADSGLAKAGWMLDWDRNALNVPSSIAVRLLVNEAHEAVLVAVGGDQSDGSRLIRSAIRADVARQLIMGAVTLDEFCEPEEPFDQDSIGAALQRLVAAYFPDETPSSLRAQVERAPFQIEAQIQSHSQMFRS